MKETEIEKKFLLKEVPNLDNLTAIDMIDVYLPEETEHAHLRARKSGEKYQMTKKAPIKKGNNYVMLEETISLTPDEFNFIYKTSNRRIEKKRYKIKHENYIIDLDVFEGKHKGLIIAEIEFPSEEELHAFPIPKNFEKEASHLECLAGGYLSGKTYDEIKNQLNG